MKRMRKGLSFLLILAMLISICTPMQVEAASKVKLNKTSHTMYVGQTYTLKISGTSKKATWSTSDKKVATVDSKGKVTAKKKGTATITAKVSNKKYTCKVTVKTPVLNATKKTLYTGQTYTLKLTGATAKTFSSNNTKVATVNSKGKVTTKKAGTATITVKDTKGRKYTCKVTVKTPTINATSKKLDIGKTYTLKLTGATAKTFSSSNTKIATVDSKGKVTAKKTGTATITVKDTKGRKYTCKITVNKCTHTWDAGKVTKKATCTATGVKTYTCKVCKATKTESTKKIAHSKGAWEITKKETCEKSGTKVIKCTVCKQVIETKKMDPTGHDYKTTVLKPTCTKQGYTTYTCACGDTYKDNYVKETGHTWGEWTTTKEPTEEAFGEEIRSCGVCGETETNTLPKKEHEHSYTSVVTEPTCTEQGYTTHTCRCGDFYVDSYVKETGHTWGEWVKTKEPTEEDFGEEIRSCGVCGETETNTLPKKEHEHSYTSVVTEPTCTEQGYTTHTCKCGDSYKDTYVDETGHSYEDSVTAPTCNAGGYTTHTCACGDTYTDAYVDADDNAHIAGEWVTTKEPTYIEVGTKTKSCTVCGKILETEEIPVLELTNGDAVYTIELAGGATDYVVGHYDTELAAELVALVNAYRVENGLTELTVHTKLQEKADTRGYQTSYLWDHKMPNGGRPTTVYGYSAENLAWYVTRTSALEIFNALKGCEDHDAIMKSTFTYNYTGVSVFCKKVGENDYEYYWVQVFM